MEYPCFRRHIAAKNERPPLFALIFKRPGRARGGSHQASHDPRAKNFVFREAQRDTFAVDNGLLDLFAGNAF